MIEQHDCRGVIRSGSKSISVEPYKSQITMELGHEET